MPKIAVIIPTLNEEKYLPQLIASLQNQKLVDFEIVVADAGSQDKTVKFALANGCKVVEGGLPSVGRNRGAMAAANDVEWFFFMDADIQFSSFFISHAISEAQKRNVKVANFYYSYTKKLLEDFMHFNWNIAVFLTQFTKHPWASGQVLLVKKDAFHELAGFNEQLETSEDFDFVVRAKRLGHKFAILPCFFEHSKRRFKAVGYARVMVGYIVSSILLVGGLATWGKGKELVRKLNGGWGKW